MSIKRILVIPLILIGTIYLSAISAKAQTIQTIYDTPPHVETCDPGVLRASEKQAVLNALNEVRARHQLSPVVYDANYDNEAAQASLIVAANHFTIYNPSTSAKCYTPAGYAGASTSNLLFIPPSDRLNPPLFASSSDDIRTWLIVKDAPNWRRRRWLLDPFLRKIAYRRVEGATPSSLPTQWG